MAIRVRQTDNGMVQESELRTCQHYADQSDAAFLLTKLNSHLAKGWNLTLQTPTAFTVEKGRHGGLCRREFWIVL